MINTAQSFKIQYLRALSVSSVVLFHIYPDVFYFGYLGVDVFFVISGFLMYSLYWSDKTTMSAFLKKRFVRIYKPFPTFFAVTSICFLLFLPSEHYVAFAVQVPFSILSVANFYFYLLGDYFSGLSKYQPLLHFWSLGVEIQFYILFGVLLNFHRFIKEKHFLIMIILFIFFYTAASLHNKSLAFYFVGSRVWEFCYGIMAAYIVQNRKRKNSLFFVIIATLLLSFITKDIIIFTVALTTVVLSIDFNIKRLSVPKLLGDYSYEIYLYHLPLIFIITYSDNIGKLEFALILFSIFLILYFLHIRPRITNYISILIILTVLLANIDLVRLYFSSHWFAAYNVSALSSKRQLDDIDGTEIVSSNLLIAGDSYAQDMFNVLATEINIRELDFVRINSDCFQVNSFICREQVQKIVNAYEQVHILHKWEKYPINSVLQLIELLGEYQSKVILYTSKQLGGATRLNHWLEGEPGYHFERMPKIDLYNKALSDSFAGRIIDLNVLRNCDLTTCSFFDGDYGILTFDGEHLTSEGVKFYADELGVR